MMKPDSVADGERQIGLSTPSARSRAAVIRPFHAHPFRSELLRRSWRIALLRTAESNSRPVVTALDRLHVARARVAIFPAESRVWRRFRTRSAGRGLASAQGEEVLRARKLDCMSSIASVSRMTLTQLFRGDGCDGGRGWPGPPRSAPQWSSVCCSSLPRSRRQWRSRGSPARHMGSAGEPTFQILNVERLQHVVSRPSVVAGSRGPRA
jgi:hypothetical protein